MGASFLSLDGLTLYDRKIKKFISTAVTENSPIISGDAEYSAVLKGEYNEYTNKAISKISVSLGAATTAGLKGWYYSAIDFTNNTITLSDIQPYVLANKLIGGSWISGTPNINAGDKISIVNDSKYDYCGEVKSISGNVITLKESLPFSKLSLSLISVNNPDDWTIYLPDSPDAGIIDIGGGALAEGVNTKATNIGSHAEGIQTHAYGQYSHTEGFKTSAGYAAHAEGDNTLSSGARSHTEGNRTIAFGNNSHTEGSASKSYNDLTEAERKTLSTTWESAKNISVAYGESSHVEGKDNLAYGMFSHAEGNLNYAKGSGSHAEGYKTTASNTASHAEGRETIANGERSHAEGLTSVAFGDNSHSEGFNTISYGNNSHAEGSASKSYSSLTEAERDALQMTWETNKNINVARGNSSHVEGKDNLAYGDFSHAEGNITYAKGSGSHSEGYKTTAVGTASHAEGRETTANANFSHAEGRGTIAHNIAEHASGQYNKSIKSDNKADATQFSIGIGTDTSDANRKNAFEVKQNGDIYIEGVEGRIQDKLNDNSPILKGTGVGSAVQTKEVETFENQAPIAEHPNGEISVDAIGDNSIVLNGKSHAGAKRALAHGNRTIASGENSHTEGHCTQVINLDDVYNGYAAHAEGYGTIAAGTYSHVEGNTNIVIASNAHAEGKDTRNYGDSSHTEGYGTYTGNTGDAPDRPVIDNSTSGGGSGTGDSNTFTNPLDGIAAHAEGNYTRAHGNYSHAEGRQCDTWAEGSHAEGTETLANGDYSHTEGNKTRTEINSLYSHAEGINTSTKGAGAHAEGDDTHAEGETSHTEGWATYAYAKAAHAEGQNTRAHAQGSHSEGENTDARGLHSHAEGCGTETHNKGEHASGHYNKSIKSFDPSDATHFSIGVGGTDTTRENAFEVKQNGDIYIKGIGNFTGDNSDESTNLADVINDLDKNINTGGQITSNIQIAGGPLANDILETDYWPDNWYENPADKTTAKIIPANTSFEDIIRTLFLNELPGTVSWTTPTWSPSVDKPTVTLSASGSLEVGTKITITTTTAGIVSNNNRSSKCSASYGYFLADAEGKPTGSHIDNKTLTKTKSGGSDNTVSYTYTWNGSTVSASGEMQVKEGTNTLKVSQSGPTVNVDALPTTKVFASTNTKKVLDKVHATLTDTKPSNKLLSNSNEYTITGVRYAFTGAVASGFECTSTYIRTNLSKNGYTKSSLTSLKAPAGNTQIIIAFPVGWGSLTKVIDNNALKAIITNNFELIDTIPVYGNNGFTAAYYKVYVYTSGVVLGEIDYTISIN